MAKTTNSILAIFFLLNFLISTAIAGREMPKHPDSFFKFDRGYLIPGVGRGIKPKWKNGFNPFTYNPVTGGNNGIPGLTVPNFGGGGGGGGVNVPGVGSIGGGGGGGVNVPGVGSIGGGSYVPGGDDTLVPNPGVEVPNPGRGGSTPTPASP